MPRFSGSEKIRTRRDWGGARRAKARAAGKPFSISVLDRCGKRLGIVVGSHIGSAVARNRIKRVVREYFRLNKTEFPDGDTVVVAKPPASRLDKKELREELRKLLQRAAG